MLVLRDTQLDESVAALRCRWLWILHRIRFSTSGCTPRSRVGAARHDGLRPDEQRKLVVDAAVGAADMYSAFTEAAGPQNENVLVALPAPGELGMVTMRLKNPDFADEHEWR